MKYFYFPLLFSLFTACIVATSEAEQERQSLSYPEQKYEVIDRRPEYRGWDYIINNLIRDKIESKNVLGVYQHPRMPRFTTVSFALEPRESSRSYRGFFTNKSLQSALECLQQHANAFELAEKHFAVNKFVLASILHIETHCGRNTGKDLVINRLSRLSSIADPENVLKNYKRLKRQDKAVSYVEVLNRAQYLERTFYPEVVALFQLSKDKNWDLFNLRGSRAGAIGIPQFLPRSYITYGFDGNLDSVVSLQDPTDSIWSVANYLSNYGWNDNSSKNSKREAIWRYNRSDAYVNAVLGVAEKLSKRSP